MDDVRTAINAAAAALAGIGDTPRLDAELLMAAAMGVSREVLLLGQLARHSLYDAPVPPAFAALLARRLAHEPIAYLTGTRAFWTIELAVGPGVLVPRADSETLLEAAVAHIGNCAPATVVDLGTGPGTLLLAALDQWRGATGLGVDASAQALEYARTNAEVLGMTERVELRLGDWAAGIDGPFDLILANPPYIGTDERLPREVGEYEPGVALFAGADGLNAYRRIAPDLPRLLAPGGVACVEIGATQAAAVSRLFEEAGLRVGVRRDYGGHDRCLIVTA